MLTVVVMIVGCGAGGEQPPVGLPDASVPVDTEAPVIVSISPPDGALGIGEDAVVLDRNIDVHIGALRKKLGRHRDRIETVRGVGYRFSDAVPA